MTIRAALPSDVKAAASVPRLPLRTSVAHGPCAQCATAAPAKRTNAVSAVNEPTRSAGDPLDASTRRLMEMRFGRDFSAVRVHTGASAAQAAASIRARAYASGNDVVFAQARYAPHTRAGQALLAHELAHVVQQSGASAAAHSRRAPSPDARAEAEADLAARAVARGANVPPLRVRSAASIAAFSDTGHHVIEEAALAGAGFGKEQREAVEQGNLQRDYSQVGTAGNAVLLCRANQFGGYDAAEHFDNFAWDVASGRWRSRGTGREFRQTDPNALDRTPLDYIDSELAQLASIGGTSEGLLHLGNALHTVEDFFAHSNFIELSKGDGRFGKTLLTGSVGGTGSASIAHIEESVSSPEMKPYYRQQAEAAEAAAPPLSHAKIAKDQPGSANYVPARRLAALVVQALAGKVLGVLKSNDKGARARLMKSEVVDRAREWLRPPDPANPWWERLSAADANAIDRRLDDADARTPATVNHCVLSPLRNIEASADSSVKIPFGVAMPMQVGRDRVWFQAGAGAYQELPLKRDTEDPAPGGGGRAGLFAGAQIVGRF